MQPTRHSIFTKIGGRLGGVGEGGGGGGGVVDGVQEVSRNV